MTTVLQNGVVLDRYETPFGIRTLAFDADGFSINGERLDIQGVCMHHDLGALGAALNERALHRQIDMLIEMGANAIRTSHNPPAPELQDYADQKGILVVDETFDVWRARKTPNDYRLLFDAWHEQDTRMLVRRDRNHPSVVMWSIGNEVPEQRNEEGAALARTLSAIVHEEDPTRKTTAAMNSARSTSPFVSAVDLIGLNWCRLAEIVPAGPDELAADERPARHARRGRNNQGQCVRAGAAFSIDRHPGDPLGDD